MSNSRRLGRGLEALLGRSLDAPTTIQEGTEPFVDAGEDASTTEVVLPACMGRDETGQLWLDLVAVDTNPHQPRKTFDEVEIADLADSIREHGVLQPLLVRSAGERFELIAGERRLRAAKLAGWERVPVQLREMTDRQMAEVAIVENVQRKDLSPLEKAESFQRYLQEYGGTQDELAKRVQIDRSTVANLIRLLELPEPVKTLLNEGKLTQGHARALLPLGDETQQVKVAKQIVDEGLSVRRTEQTVQETIAELDGDNSLSLFTGEDSTDKATKAKPPISEQIVALETELKSLLGTRVAITRNAKGKGKITLHFADGDEFDRLHTLLKGGSLAVEAA